MDRETPIHKGKPPKAWGRRSLFFLGVLLLGTIILGVSVGSVNIPFTTIFRLVAQNLLGMEPGFTPESSISAYQAIIWEVRLPRVILAGGVGMSLAFAGTAFQGVFKNPLADPQIIGVSQGAALGACLAIFWGLQRQWSWFNTLPLAAFLGALATILLVYFISRQGSRLPVQTLLLGGIAVGTFFSAWVSVIILFSGQQLHSILFWLMGGFSGRSWAHLQMAAPYFLVGCGVLLLFIRELNLLLLGEESAQHLGLDVEKTKRILLGVAALLTAAAVAVSGVIGFVGLIVPHAMRLLLGPDHRLLLPAAGLGGAIFLILADILARTLAAPIELPVGVITALCGTPFFLYLLKKNQSTYWG